MAGFSPSMEAYKEPVTLISQRALTEALGGKKKRSKALRDLAAKPLPGRFMGYLPQ